MDYGTFINHCEQYSLANTCEIDDAWGELYEKCHSKNLHISQMYGIRINTRDKEDMVSIHNGKDVFTVRLCNHNGGYFIAGTLGLTYKCVETSPSTEDDIIKIMQSDGFHGIEKVQSIPFPQKIGVERVEVYHNIHDKPYGVYAIKQKP